MRGKPLDDNDTNDDEGNNASLINLFLVWVFLTFQALNMTFMTFLTISYPDLPPRGRGIHLLISFCAVLSQVIQLKILCSF